MLNELEFSALVSRLDRAGYWPARPEAGALNFLTPEATLGGLQSVTEGTVISCADPEAARRMFRPDSENPPITTSTDAAQNWLAVNEEVRYQQHGHAAMTHVDALGHFFFGNRGYAGTTPSVVFDHGVRANDVTPASGGIVGRGLLLDLPRLIDRPYVPSGTVITLAQVRRWLAATETEPHSGDLLFVRTGRPLLPPPEPGSGFDVGTLDLDCAEWIHDCEFSLVLSDAGMDAPAPMVQDVLPPWHILLLVAMGLFQVDCANLEELSVACRDRNRTVFLAVIASLPLPGATASPVNPLAIL
jgi:hypothetical protein